MKSNKYLRAFGKLHYFVHIGIVAFIVGVLGSLVSYLFETLIILSRNIFFYGRFDLINVPGELNRSIWGIGIILVPVAGSFIVTFLGSNLDKSQRGLSVPELMYTIRFKLGGVNPLVAILKTISAAITIGSGGSVGRTGPVLSMGAAISWLISSIVRLTSRDKVIVLAAGSAAIIAAIFNTPIAGVVFAVELLLARVTSAALFVIIIAAFSASYFEYMYIDLLPILKLTVEHESLNKLIRLDLMFYCFVLGVIVSFVSAFFIKGIYFFEEFFKNHFTNRYLRHAFGMFLVGLMVYFFIRNFGSYYIDEINFEIENYTDDSVVLLADVFTGEDIVNVLSGQQHSRLDYVGNMYRFSFAVQISKQGAQRFAKITQGQEIFVSPSGESYLVTPLVIFLDEKEVSSLNIASSLAGQEVLTPSITGTRETKEDAVKEMNRLKSIIQSGKLPAKPEIVKMDTISPFLGKEFISSTVYVILSACVVVSLIVFIRYRNLKIVFPMLAASLSEIALILGIAASQIFGAFVLITAIVLIIIKGEVNNVLRWITILLMFVMGFAVVLAKWTLDVPAFAGLIAIIGTSVGQMIIITDQVVFGSENKPFAKRYENALNMIWNSAATVVAAMFPLIFLGVGMLKGFAITIVIGVTVGIMITRPAYAAILEKIKKEK